MAQLRPFSLLLLALTATAAHAQIAGVIGPVTPHRFDRDLRTLPKALPIADREVDDRHLPPIDPAWTVPLAGPDPVLQSRMPATRSGSPIAGANFAGISFTGPRPPDPIGDVGPRHYVQMVNTSLAIFDRTGALLAGPVSISTLWAGFGGPCATQNAGDPVVVFDPLADRWVVAQFHFGPNGICVAVSQTSNPVSGGWFLYDFSGLPSFPDYYKIGVWPNAYYVGANASSNRAMALDRAQMLVGGPAAAIVRTVGGVGVHVMLTPADVDGLLAPDPDAPGIFYRHIDDAVGGGSDRVELFEFAPNFVTPASSTFTGPVAIVTEAFGSLCGFSFSCVFQPGTAQRLDSVTEWPMWRVAHRRFATHELLLANNAVDAGGATRPGVRWYELRRTPAGGGAWSIHQQGTFAPGSATENRWMASLAMDASGNIGMGYSYTDSGVETPVQPSLRFTGRLAADPPGLMTQGETTIVAGTGIQSGSNRWGDYSAMSVDPADECSFWFTGEYMGGGNAWETRIASYRFPGCMSPVIFLGDFEWEGYCEWSAVTGGPPCPP